jgi:hypothetical protein
MIMQIKDIKDQRLKDLAVLRYIEQRDIDCITWDQTPEGTQFWNDVNNGKITEMPNDMQVLGNDIQEFHRANIAAIMLIAIINSQSRYTEGIKNNMEDAVYLADALLDQLKK